MPRKVCTGNHADLKHKTTRDNISKTLVYAAHYIMIKYAFAVSWPRRRRREGERRRRKVISAKVQLWKEFSRKNGEIIDYRFATRLCSHAQGLKKYSNCYINILCTALTRDGGVDVSSAVTLGTRRVIVKAVVAL